MTDQAALPFLLYGDNLLYSPWNTEAEIIFELNYLYNWRNFWKSQLNNESEYIRAMGN